VGACAAEGTLVCSDDEVGATCDVAPGDPGDELCGNGLDDDCDGELDEGFDLGRPCEAGVGACQRAGETVCAEDGLSTSCGIEVGAAAVELCGDGIDNDCDDEVDEGFDLGAACSEGTGACRREGREVCSDDRLSTQCSAEPGVAGRAELCGNLLDDDCDGEVDEGFDIGACEVGVGDCRREGEYLCSADRLEARCNAVPGRPRAERCGNEVDDDCDGEVDEGYPIGEACSAGIGECEAEGEYACSRDGLGFFCDTGAGNPGLELCGNGLDDDCDGEIDEGFDVGARCRVGVGQCRAGGSLVCAEDRTGTVCNAREGQPGVELCGNRLDDDCDGAADEGFDVGAPCEVGVGACRREGVVICSRDGMEARCSAVPGRPTAELCGNGQDDDCDGAADEGFDALGDACDGPDSDLCTHGLLRCSDDGRELVCGRERQTDIVEECNGEDDDCDEQVDEGPDDEPLSRSCYTGPEGTEGVGICAPGLRRCLDGVWQRACEGQVLPADDICNGADDDCSGRVDEGCACVPGEVQPCYTGPEGTQDVGACRAGEQRCREDGQWGECAGAVEPRRERCDGVDEDCDGRVDDAPEGGPLTRACYGGEEGTQDVGPCHGGEQTCQRGRWLEECRGEVVPSPELCNRIDDDCDGAADEGVGDGPLTRGCYTGPDETEEVGQCSGGQQACLRGRWQLDCVGQVLPGREACNGEDEDCNGVADNGPDGRPLLRSCFDGADELRGVGLCRAGTQICTGGGWPEACEGQVLPVAEECNGDDDDCDGQADEDGERQPLTQACYTGDEETEGVGACRAGERRCERGLWSRACYDQVLPGREACNGIDDDCDGAPDEDREGQPMRQACYSGEDGTEGVGLCDGGWHACLEGRWERQCHDQTLPAEEVCNGADDDCDGDADEGCDCQPGDRQACYRGPEGTEGVGRCEAGEQVCDDNGAWGDCSGDIGPARSESCNGIDDDCDGAVDEGIGERPLARACYTGEDGTEGVGLCEGGSQLCLNGEWGRCGGQTLPRAEICNGEDDDCDGLRDEGDDGEPLDRQCYSGDEGEAGVGACRAGTQVCLRGRWPDGCPGEVLPDHEACNGVDDDCDGAVDLGPDGEALSRPCYGGQEGTEGVGLCTAGTQHCSGGFWLRSCEGEVRPSPELCNGEDDDCDGVEDEDPRGNRLTQPCYTGEAGTEDVGLCHGGTRVCMRGGWSEICGGQVLPADEQCNGADDDCDAAVDEDVQGAPLTQACYNGPDDTEGVGLCEAGTQACRGGAWEQRCSGEVVPRAELCNSADDDCDGAADEAADGTPMTQSCYTGDEETLGVGVCRAGERACINGFWGRACDGQVLPSDETCNGLDDDCDRRTDVRDCYSGPEGTEGVGICRAGTQTCARGRWPVGCSGEVTPARAEICGNRADDDCDGLVNEGCRG